MIIIGLTLKKNEYKKKNMCFVINPPNIVVPGNFVLNFF